jgi:hypothetical protein
MRHRSRAAGTVAGLALILMAGQPAMAATSTPVPAPGATPTVHVVTVSELRLDGAECMAAAPLGRTQSGRTLRDACTASVTYEMTATRAPSAPGGTRPHAAPADPDPLATTSACTITWTITSLRATVQSVFWGVFWSATANATGYGDSCGRVMWTSVTCDQHGIGYAVRIDWCGAYPGRWAWYAYTSSNIGLNITVSAVANGTPISWTHGARNGFNPYTGTQYGFVAW